MPSFGIDLLKWPAGQVPVGQTNGPDGLDDIWQGLYNAWTLDPLEDYDGDGCSNAVESIAGTNPFDPKDCLKVGSTAITGGNVIFTVKAEAGKKYRVLSYDAPNGAPTVVSMTAPVAGTQWIPTTVQASAPVNNIVITKPVSTRKFYRLETSDVDTDNDGVSDWAELKLGLNPNAADSDLDGVPDGTLVTQELQTPDVVTISATKSIAAEDPLDSGEITITRARKLLPITVNYSITGTATQNTDYSAALVTAPGVTGSGTAVNLAAGKTSAVINIAPIADSVVEAGESVTVSLDSATTGSLPNPTIGFPDSATVIINNSTAATGTGLTGRYYDTSSSTYADASNFGQGGMYSFVRSASPTTTGTAVMTYTGPTIPGLAVGTQVKINFTSGNANINNVAFNNQVFAVTAVTASSFTVTLNSATSFGGTTATNGTCLFAIQSFTHPATVTRVDATVNFDWQYGTPNGVTIAPLNSPDNYSATWECYLSPTTAGSYVFQLDADDKAEVLLDTGSGLTQIVEHNWNSPGSDAVGTFKQSAPVTLAVPASPAQRYHMVVHHVETTGDARCRLQWSINGGTFANIPQANQFAHTQAMSYSYTSGNIVVTQIGGHSFSVGNTVPVAFTSGQLFTPGAASTYNNAAATITAVAGTVPVVTISGASTSAGSATVTVPSTANLAVGMAISGTGLPANEFITAIGSGTITVTTGTNVTAQASTTLTATSTFTIAAPNAQVAINGASTSAGSATVSVPSVAGLSLGMLVTGTGLPANEIITAIGTNTITVSTGTGVTAQASTNLTATLNGIPIAVAGSTTTAGSPVVAVPSITGLATGMMVTGTGLPANEFITSIAPGLITITTGTGVTAQASTTITAIPQPTGATAGSGFVLNNSTSTTTGLYNLCYPNTGFTGSPGRVAVDAAVTTANNGIWLSGTPDVALIQPDTFSARWTGQVQPQFSEEYTFVVQADDGCALWLNGQPQVLKMVPSASTGTATYLYDSTTGNTIVNYNGLPVVPGSFVVGETVRIDPTSGNLSHAPTTSPTYTYDPATNNVTVDYTNLVIGSPGGTMTPGGIAAGDTIELDPTSGGIGPLTSTAYQVTGASGNTFTVNVGSTVPLVTLSTPVIVGIATGSPCLITTKAAHGLTTGDTVIISGVAGGTFSPAINGTFAVTVVSSTTFSVPSNCTLAPTPYTGSVLATTGNIAVNDTRNAVITALHAAGTGTYSYTSTTGLAVVDYSALAGVPSGSFAVGDKVLLDPTSGNASALTNAVYTISAASGSTFTVSFGVGAFTTGTGSLTIVDTRTGIIPDAMTTAFEVNIVGGKYANPSIGNVSVEIVNKAMKDWSSNGNERYVRIPMTGGLRYDIQLDMYEATGASRCFLSWFSASQPKQIIPAERLYPATGPLQPPASTTPTDAVALVGGAFSLPVTGANGSAVTVSGLPAWLTYSGGVLSGTPPAGAAGTYQIIVTTTGSASTGTSVINLQVQENAGNVSREIWSGVTGTTVGAIPTSEVPSLTSTLTALESPVNYGDNYGERIRGYITAPVTGNYYFWIAASNAAELWIANNDDSVNTFRRSWVATGTASREWSAAGETHQKSGWLALEAGKRYYVEILHKAGVGSDNLAVGWSKPGESTATPSEVVPSYVLSPYIAPAAGSTPGTLYISTMLAQAGAVTNGVGSATLRVSDDESVAYLRFSYSGLTGALTSKHIHADPYLSHPPGEIIFDIDTPDTPGDGLVTNPTDPNFGAYKWTIAPRGTYSAAEIREIIKEGKTYINLHTGMYPNGEIRGNFTLSNGTRTFTPPPAPPAWSDDSNTDAGAVRFLTQASFGANISDITALKAMSPSGTTNSRYETWINDQFTKSQTSFLPEVLAREIADVFGSFDVKVVYDTWWKTSMTAQDQLRQKVAFALSQIHVVSGSGPLEDNSRAIAHFYDALASNAFGNFSDVLTGTTLTPGMGRYLDMLRNDKPDISVGRSPNENYAREIKQLFSIGLYRMWPDGTLMLSEDDAPIDTYSQREIVGLAHVFTGWDYGYDGAYRTGFSATADWTRPMREVPVRHFTGAKRVLNNEVFPGISTLNGQPLDPYANHVSVQYNDPAYLALPAQELAAAHSMLFNHPNVGPFICRQLIQRMVTSNPSRDYLYRVVQKFNDNGAGVRGDMQAVIKAILLDYEARSPNMIAIPAFGKQREPVQRVTNAARALRPSNVTGTYSQTAAQYNGSGQPYILITTSSPHLLSSGNSVFLEFTDTTGDPAKPAPTTGTYVVLSSPTPTTTTYAVAAPGWLAGSYSQTAGNNFITVTMSGHWLPGTNASYSPALPAANFGQAYFDFVTAVTGTLPADGIRTTTSSTSYDTASGVGNNSGTTFTIPAPDTTARGGLVAICRFPSSYSSSGRNGTITIDTTYSSAGSYGTMANHHLAVGDQVFLNFMNSRDTTSFNETSTENDLVYTITGVPDPNTFTVQARDAANAAMASDNQVTVFPLEAQPLVRSGTINTRPSTYAMDNTDTDLAQTPLNSPTVFNYFLPDYKFAGALASQGITTPEFQLTSETTVIRQANFFHAGIFNPSSTTGYSSFKNGTNAMVLDLSRWMGTTFPLGSDGFSAPTNVNKAWTSNENLSLLIDHLNTLLLAGQLPGAAKSTIISYLNTPVSGITVSNPCSISTASAHGLVDGDSITISGVSGGTFRNSANTTNVSINQTFTVTVTGTTTFTLNITGGIRCTSTSGLVLTSAYYSPIAYTDTAVPTATHMRDRLRNIIHLILTSPDYAIQR